MDGAAQGVRFTADSPAWIPFTRRAPARVRISGSAVRTRVRRTGRARKPGGTAAPHSRHDFSTGCLEEFLGRLLKMREKSAVVIAVSKVNFKNRNAPVIFHFGIEFDKIIFARQHFASGNPDPRLRYVMAFDVLLPLRAVAGKICRKHRIFTLASGRVNYVATDEVLARGLCVDIDPIRDCDPGGFSIVKTT